MASLLTHRYRDQQFKVKRTKCHHHLLRHVYRGCNGVEQTNWERVSASTIDELREQCIEQEIDDE